MEIQRNAANQIKIKTQYQTKSTKFCFSSTNFESQKEKKYYENVKYTIL